MNQKQNEDSRIILPMNDPVVKTWGECHLMSIVSDKQHFKAWVSSLFIQMIGFTFIHRGIRNPPHYHFLCANNPYSHYQPGNAWDLCPFIQKNVFNRDTISRLYDTFKDFAIDSLQNGYYVCVFLNRIFEPSKSDPGHLGMLYGYDYKEDKFYLADHYTNGKYDYYQVESDRIERAYQEIDDIMQTDYVDEARKLEYDQIYYIRPKEYDFQFSIETCKYSLEQYLFSNNNTGFVGKHSRFYTIYSDYVYGIQCYDSLLTYLHELYDSKNYCDWRSICFFQDHKKIIHLLIETLIEKNYINNKQLLAESSYLENQFNIVLNVFIKFILTKDTRLLDKIIDIIQTLYRIEKKLLQEIFHTIDTTIAP